MASTGASTSSAHSEPPQAFPQWPSREDGDLAVNHLFLARLGVDCTSHYSLFITRTIGEKGEIYDGSRQVGKPDF